MQSAGSLLLAAMVATAVGLSYLYDDLLLQWLSCALGSLTDQSAAILFVGVSVLMVLLLVPVTPVLLLASGYLGFIEGFLLGTVGYMLGSLLAFIIGRYLLQNYIASHLPRKVQHYIFESHIYGWRLIGILHLSCVLPTALISYGLSITRYSIWTFSWSTLVFSLPYLVIVAYSGAIGRQVLEGELMTLVPALGLIILIIFFVKTARNRLR